MLDSVQAIGRIGSHTAAGPGGGRAAGALRRRLVSAGAGRPGLRELRRPARRAPVAPNRGLACLMRHVTMEAV